MTANGKQGWYNFTVDAKTAEGDRIYCTTTEVCLRREDEKKNEHYPPGPWHDCKWPRRARNPEETAVLLDRVRLVGPMAGTQRHGSATEGSATSTQTRTSKIDLVDINGTVNQLRYSIAIFNSVTRAPDHKEPYRGQLSDGYSDIPMQSKAFSHPRARFHLPYFCL
jgi:hypothetical protein